MGFGDRVFWSAMCFIAISLIWLGLVEKYLPMWVSLFVSGGVIILIAKHPRFRK